MSKTSTKKDLNRKHNPASNQSHAPWHASRHAAAASAKATEVKKKRPWFGNTGGTGKPRKKSQDQKKQKLSHQQATQARDSLDAEFRDLRAVSNDKTRSAFFPLSTQAFFPSFPRPLPIALCHCRRLSRCLITRGVVWVYVSSRLSSDPRAGVVTPFPCRPQTHNYSALTAPLPRRRRSLHQIQRYSQEVLGLVLWRNFLSSPCKTWRVFSARCELAKFPVCQQVVSGLG
ncbi:hypothetical protein BC827DRAFT_735329 [Russula dissimulans]|nr:hypothetical protein BC827DRAFT_735329 [Russula dissimulans]